jgi:DNA-binding CsgD family transcriptional regulator
VHRPASDWASLTPAERAVAGLVADGLTNPQIGERLYVSLRTVQTHLVHVFAKLGIASRAQLAAQVTHHRRQEPPPAQVAPAEDSALIGEPPRGAYLPGSVLSPAAGRRKQRFTAQPPVRGRRRRYPPDGGCPMPPQGGRVKTMAPREGAG